MNVFTFFLLIVPVFEEYLTTVSVHLLYEVETACSETELDRILELIATKVVEVLMQHANRYIGLCGTGESTCRDVVVTIVNCMNQKKRQTKHALEVNLLMRNIS